MHTHSCVLVLAGSLCLMLTLALAWCLAGVRSSAAFRKLFPNDSSLLKAHLDYLMMAGLLLIFYLLFAQLHVVASPVILLTMAAGSLLNPVGFIVMAVKPGVSRSPKKPFGLLMTFSFVLTTIGYGGAAWSVAYAAAFQQ